MERDFAKEIEYLVAHQTLLAKNVDALFETSKNLAARVEAHHGSHNDLWNIVSNLAAAVNGMSAHVDAMIASQKELIASHQKLVASQAALVVGHEELERKLASLAATVEAYIKGLRNGG